MTIHSTVVLVVISRAILWCENQKTISCLTLAGPSGEWICGWAPPQAYMKKLGPPFGFNTLHSFQMVFRRFSDGGKTAIEKCSEHVSFCAQSIFTDAEIFQKPGFYSV